MSARGARTERLAWLLALLCCAGPPLMSAQIGGGTASPGQDQSPSSAAGRSPVAAVSGQSQTGGLAREEQAQPEKRKAKPETADGLTFLPELRPTDGVPSLPPAAPPAAAAPGQVTMDRAVAVINGEVILASDVREQQHFAVFEPLAVPNGEFTPMQAMQHIVNRTLLLQQMTEQALVQPPSDDAVDKQIDELRKHIPACAGQDCETDEGWRRFLASRGYTVEEFHKLWKQRMQILNFVEVRFRTGIRIAKPEIERYYRETLVPQFEARKVKAPPLAVLSPRIDEVLLQQHVNVLLTDYLRSLKDAGNVQILDPAYNELGNQTSQPPVTAAVSSNNVKPGTRSGGEE